jgi:hypothetical protein
MNRYIDRCPPWRSGELRLGCNWMTPRATGGDSAGDPSEVAAQRSLLDAMHPTSRAIDRVGSEDSIRLFGCRFGSYS